METPNLLIQAPDSSQAIRRLFERLKEDGKPRSLTWLCRESGVTSKGYLSDVMAGRRRLSPRHVAGISKAFRLDRMEKRLLSALVCRDREKKPEKRQTADEHVNHLRRAAQNRRGSMPTTLSRSFFAIELFCAFGLFGGRATEGEFVQLYGTSKKASIRSALKTLIDEGYVGLEGETYSPLKNAISFSGSDDGLSHIRFLELALEDAKKAAKKHYENASECFFESNIISVRKAEFVKALAAIKDEVRLTEAKLETGDGDSLIRFNVQIYPLAERLTPLADTSPHSGPRAE